MDLRAKLASAAAGTALLLLALIAAIAACRSTDDPREGIGGAGTSSSTSAGGAASSSGVPGSSSGGLDAAALPAKGLECGPAPVSTAPFTKQALLGAAADCAAWHSCNFLNAATTLRKAVQDSAGREAAWKLAMDEASKLEGFRFGPWASKGVDPYQGRGLRSFVHPWPDLSRCEVEKQVVVRDYEKGWDRVFANGRGLFALEVLFFYPGTDTACLPASEAGKKWTATAPADLRVAKDAYARAVADNIAAVGLEQYEGASAFKAKLLAAEGYGSEQEALNVVAWSLFYPEAEVKDDKLAALAGVATTPPNRETPYAKVDIENIRTNLRAFRALFQGCGADGAGIGFDDWLTAAGHQQLATDILAATTAIDAAAAAFPPFDQASPAQFKSLYDTVRVLSNLIKGSLFGSGSPLNLKLPASAASDTD